MLSTKIEHEHNFMVTGFLDWQCVLKEKCCAMYDHTTSNVCLSHYKMYAILSAMNSLEPHYTFNWTFYTQLGPLDFRNWTAYIKITTFSNEYVTMPDDGNVIKSLVTGIICLNIAS